MGLHSRRGSWLKKAQTQRAPSLVLLLSPTEVIKREMDMFMQSPRADAESNPLAWWRVYANTYPTLADLAKKYLCIPASSSPSERVFSTAGCIVYMKHNCLKANKVGELVFLAKNL